MAIPADGVVVRGGALATRNIVRIVAGSAPELSRALEKTPGFAQPVALMCNLEIRVLALRHVERDPEVSQRLAGQIREWRAVEALQADRVRRLILVRPAVEAGERLGFLPGDLTQKVDPYLRPMYDALYEMMGFDRVARFIERNVIEVAPLAFMRGRSLNDSFIILDEAQNTTIEQMKMFLTRIGFGSRAVVTGDVTQTDLPAGRQSGLSHVVEVLRNVPGVAFTFFDAQDVVRHPLVQRIVQAYESHGGST